MLQVNPIIAAAAANMLVGFVIYSKHTFGPMISKLSGKKVSGLKDMPLRIAIEAVSSLMKASALYIAIITFQKSESSVAHNMLTNVYSWFVTHVANDADIVSSLKIAGFFWLGFMVPHILCHLAWNEHMNIKKSSLKAVLSLVHILVMAATIAYFG